MLAVLGDILLDWMNQNSREIQCKDAGIKILIDRFDGFPSEIFDLQSVLDCFVTFFHAPSFMIERRKPFPGITFGIEQG